MLREMDLTLLFTLLQGHILGLPDHLVNQALDRGDAVERAA
jgi:hypothetical protein